LRLPVSDDAANVRALLSTTDDGDDQMVIATGMICQYGRGDGAVYTHGIDSPGREKSRTSEQAKYVTNSFLHVSQFCFS